MQRISSAWTSGLKGRDKQEMEELVKTSTILLDRLSKILYNMQESKRKTVLADYDTPSWSHKQAHLNGELEVLRELQEILTIRERDDHPNI